VLVVTTAPGTGPVLLAGRRAERSSRPRPPWRSRSPSAVADAEAARRVSRTATDRPLTCNDVVIQRLFATGMQLESVARFVDRPEAAARVRRAVDDLDTTIREIRSTIYALTTGPADEPTSLRSRFFEVVDAGAEQLGHTPAVRLAGLVDTSRPVGGRRAPAGRAA
jgi:hypothetical protein